MTSYNVSQRHAGTGPRRERESGVGVKILALFLGLGFGVLTIAGVVVIQTADSARDEARAAVSSQGHTAPTDTDSGAVSLPLQSFAGKTAPGAEELAAARPATDAVLPAVPAGDVVEVHMTLKDMVMEVAPGVKYNTWAFDGHGAPGPIIHVRQGQTVKMTLTNGGALPHSIDFHAARIAPDVAFKDVDPGIPPGLALQPAT